jgi:hypothetical protein
MCAIALSRPGNFFANSSSCCHWAEPVSLSIATKPSSPVRTSAAPDRVDPPERASLPPPLPHAASTSESAARTTMVRTRRAGTITPKILGTAPGGVHPPL